MASATLRHRLFARYYPLIARRLDAQGAGDHRRRLLAGLRGRVVEVGAGHGINFAYYPAEVTEVIAVEPNPDLRAQAAEAATQALVPVRVVDGSAERLPLDDASVDAAVASLVLCSVPSQAAALAEIARVLGPDGQLRFYEHVGARNPRAARLQAAVEPVWRFAAAGCHLTRDTATAITDAGFVLETCERFAFPPSRIPLVSAPHILGVARPPTPAAA
jgi:SAM-dependent methyltransferase